MPMDVTNSYAMGDVPNTRPLVIKSSKPCRHVRAKEPRPIPVVRNSLFSHVCVLMRFGVNIGGGFISD